MELGALWRDSRNCGDETGVIQYTSESGQMVLKTWKATSECPPPPVEETAVYEKYRIFFSLFF